ncbi:enhancer of mRNA decapping [Gonapodya sp. JEL0774]|nr:enhancer of mRNA decapping [Gonapodya sp. JEL0774]
MDLTLMPESCVRPSSQSAAGESSRQFRPSQHPHHVLPAQEEDEVFDFHTMEATAIARSGQTTPHSPLAAAVAPGRTVPPPSGTSRDKNPPNKSAPMAHQSNPVGVPINTERRGKLVPESGTRNSDATATASSLKQPVAGVKVDSAKRLPLNTPKQVSAAAYSPLLPASIPPPPPNFAGAPKRNTPPSQRIFSSSKSPANDSPLESANARFGNVKHQPLAPPQIPAVANSPSRQTPRAPRGTRPRSTSQNYLSDGYGEHLPPIEDIAARGGTRSKARHHSGAGVPSSPSRSRTGATGMPSVPLSFDNRTGPQSVHNWSSADVSSYHSQEFDFAANLALFDKPRVMREVAEMDHTRREDRLVYGNTMGEGWWEAEHGAGVRLAKVGVREFVLSEAERQEAEASVASIGGGVGRSGEELVSDVELEHPHEGGGGGGDTEGEMADGEAEPDDDDGEIGGASELEVGPSGIYRDVGGDATGVDGFGLEEDSELDDHHLLESSATASHRPGRHAFSSTDHTQAALGLLSAVRSSGSPTLSPSVAQITRPVLVSTITRVQVPCVTPKERNELEKVCVEEMGVSEEAMVENGGRGVAMVGLQVLGVNGAKGASVGATVVLAGNHRAAAHAVCAARHMCNQEKNVMVFVVGREDEMVPPVSLQLRSYLATLNPLTRHKSDLPVRPALIIDALLPSSASELRKVRTEDRVLCMEVVEWAKSQQELGACLVCLECPSGMEGETGGWLLYTLINEKRYTASRKFLFWTGLSSSPSFPSIIPRYTLALGLPLTALSRAAVGLLGDVLVVYLGVPVIAVGKVARGSWANPFGGKFVAGMERVASEVGVTGTGKEGPQEKDRQRVTAESRGAKRRGKKGEKSASVDM